MCDDGSGSESSDDGVPQFKLPAGYAAALSGLARSALDETRRSMDHAALELVDWRDTHLDELHICADAQKASSLVVALNADLIRACLMQLGSTEAVLRARCVCKALRDEASSNEVWSALYERRWPSWSLLSLRHRDSGDAVTTFGMGEFRGMCDLVSGADPTSPIRPAIGEASRSRFCISLSHGRVFQLSGWARDDYDGNTTPMRVVLCRAPRELTRAGLDEDSILGEVQYGAGSLHNEPKSTTLYGHLRRTGPDVDAVEWREHSQNFGHWIYRGQITREGRGLCGSFHLSVLPRKSGTFELAACTSLDTESLAPATAQLAQRVVVRWCNGSLTRRAAQAAIIDGAAHIAN
jgi:hypothetical protein